MKIFKMMIFFFSFGSIISVPIASYAQTASDVGSEIRNLLGNRSNETDINDEIGQLLERQGDIASPAGVSDAEKNGHFVCGFDRGWSNTALSTISNNHVCPEGHELSSFTSTYYKDSRRNTLLELIRSTGQREDRFIALERHGFQNAAAMKCQTADGTVKKLIIWDPQFMGTLDQEAGTEWASIAVLAHEIGHHVNDDTVQDPRGMPSGKRKVQELWADFWSGHQLRKLGADRQDAVAVFNLMGEGGETHPPSHERVKRATDGWNSAANDSTNPPTRTNSPTRTNTPTSTNQPQYATVCAQPQTGQPVCPLHPGAFLLRGTPCFCPGFFGTGIAL